MAKFIEGQKILKMDVPDKVVDIREDAEQEKRGQEVVELLVAAGYFRARIKVRYRLWQLSGDLTNCGGFLIVVRDPAPFATGGACFWGGSLTSAPYQDRSAWEM